jgi:two-component system chemotaxis response regulator CheB
VPKIRVLVVEDSLTVRKRIVEILAADPELEVIGEAEDGRRAIELCMALRPDVMTLDMMLPVMTGVAVTEYLMAYAPTPILIVSASVNRGELHRTYDALGAGAVDVFDKQGGEDLAWSRELVDRVKMVSRIKVITHLRGKLGLSSPPPVPRSNATVGGKASLVVMGASTGGPSAVMHILRALPADYPVPILLVVHIGQPFGLALAEWLDGQGALRVRTAEHGAPLPVFGQPGVLIAPPDRHLAVRGARLELDSGPPLHSCRPSIDVLFQSVADSALGRVAGCLLTGMGRDGAQGLLSLQRAGAITIAQDEASSVIFGMPREAIALGAVGLVLPLDEIAGALMALADKNATA